MNFKTTLVLVLLVTAVSVYFLFFELGTPGPRQRHARADTSQTPLFEQRPVQPQQFRRLTVERPGERVVLEQSRGQWRQVEPVNFVMEESAVQRLATTIAELYYVDRFAPADGDDALSLREAGLEPPLATVTLDHGDRAHQLRLGKRAPGGHGYLLRDGMAEIHVVNDDLHDMIFEHGVRDWRKRRLESPEPAATERLVIVGDEKTVEARRHEGRWYLDDQHRQRASRQAIEKLVEAVGQMRIEQFIEDQPSDLGIYGLDEPRMTLALHTPALEADESDDADTSVHTHTLRLGSSTDLEASQFFALWSVDGEDLPVVFTLTDSDVESLIPDLADLRDPHPLTTSPREINAIEIERSDSPTLHLVRRRDRGFAFGDPDPGYRCDYDATANMLERLAQVEASGYVADFEPESEPIATVRIAPRGGAAGETMRVYESDDRSRYLTVRDEEPVAYRVDAETLADLFKPRLAFRDKQVLDVAEAHVTRVTMVRDDGQAFRFKRADENGDEPSQADQRSWMLEGEDGFESRAFSTLLSRLSPLRVERWITDEQEAVDTDRADEGWCVLTVELDEGSPLVLQVDPRSRRGTLDGMEAAFVVSARLAEALAAEYRDRTVLDVRRDDIESVTIERAGDRLTVRRGTDGRYVADDDDGAENRNIAQSHAGRLFDALAGLRVTRYENVDAQALPDPAQRLTVRCADERVYELALLLPEDEDDPWQHTAILDGRVLRLSERDFERLAVGVR